MSATAGVRVRVEVVAGGEPSPAEREALAAAVGQLADGAEPPPPPVYRSRWRRAAALDGVHDVRDLRDPGPAWTGTR